MEPLVALLKPLVVPLLKLDFSPPHLPEGSTLVRHLRPSESWLTYKYLVAAFSLLGQVIGTLVACIALLSEVRAGWFWAVVLVLVQLATLSFALVTTRVDYELRHYLVGDRTLRACMGALSRTEVTLSYANVQNVEVLQGPLERLFGFKSLILTTAGADTTPGTADNLHVVTLVGLTDADAIKTLVLEMLKKHRDSGLGDAPEGDARPSMSPTLLAEVRTAAQRLEAACFEAANKSIS